MEILFGLFPVLHLLQAANYDLCLFVALVPDIHVITCEVEWTASWLVIGIEVEVVRVRIYVAFQKYQLGYLL